MGRRINPRMVWCMKTNHSVLLVVMADLSVVSELTGNNALVSAEASELRQDPGNKLGQVVDSQACSR